MEPIQREHSAQFGEAKESPGALALARRQTRLDQKLEMTRDPRLRLSKDCDEFADSQLGCLKEAEDAKPRLLASRLEASKQRRKGDRQG